MRNVHERHVAAHVDRVGAVIETLASDDDRVWPGATWVPMVLDRGLEPGSRGGHGPIRYTVTAHEAGRHVAFAFDAATGIEGTHVFSAGDVGDGTTLLRHDIEARTHGAMVLLWPLAVRWLHDDLIEDAFDRVQSALGVGPAVPAQWSPWVRLLRRAWAAADRRAAVRQVETPAALLAAAQLPRVDFCDTFSLRLPAGSSRDVDDWHDRLVTVATPAWLHALMAVRNQLAKRLGLRTAEASLGAGTSPFALLARTGDTLVLGADDTHLDVRAVLRLVGDDLQLATVVQEHNTVGRAYFFVVKPFHRRIAPALLRRVSREATAPAA